MAVILKGTIIKLDINRMGINGEGIGYYNKMAVFVKGAIQKEKIWAKITEVHDNYYEAEIDSFIEKSNRRVEPFCKFYSKCGACNMQHIKDNEQLKIKREILINSLKRYAKFIDIENTNIGLTVPSKEIAYRNKSQLPFRDTNFGLSLGLYEEQTNKFIYIDECLIQNKLVNEINDKVLTILRKHNMHTPKEGGILLYLVTRAITETKEAQVTFIVSDFDERLDEIAEDIINDIPYIKSVFYSIQVKGSVQIFGKDIKLLKGKNYIKDDCLGLKVSLSPKSFYQLNKNQALTLYKEIIDDISGTDNIIFDGYSGIGILGMLLKDKAKHIYSVDLNSDSIRNAILIARENEVKNITFYSDRIESRFPELIKEGINPDIVILDPPRSGLDIEVIKTLNKISPKFVYYISCNSSTLAKDLDKLKDRYKVNYIKPYDFFVETALVESIVKLELK